MPVNMLTTLEVDNFKSLKNTKISFSKNTFFIGLNGAGKTSILQVIDFLSVLASGEVEEWLENRKWNKKDLTFFKSRKSLITIAVTFNLDKEKYMWELSFNKQDLKCTKESIYRINRVVTNDGAAVTHNGKVVHNNSLIMSVDNGEYKIYSDVMLKEKISFKYTGSILSAIKSDLLGSKLNNIREFFCNIRSAELLTPVLMKQRARESDDGIGLGGEKLSAFINGLDDLKKEKLNNTLKKFFPNIKSFETKSLRSGWKTLSLVEAYGKENIETDSMHLSDGILRILAILAQLLTTESILIFDEIEDGINQEFVEKLVDILIDSKHQTIVATHSPLLLNYIDDEIAKESILFVYKRKDGSTEVVNFFEAIKKLNKINQYELDMFGPGEVMQSVNLLELTKQLVDDVVKNENSD